MIAQIYQNLILKNPKQVFIFLIIVLFSFGYYSKDFRLYASSEPLLIEGDPDLESLQPMLYVEHWRARGAVQHAQYDIQRDSSPISYEIAFTQSLIW